MPNYILTYHGATIPKTAEEGTRRMAQWQSWADSLGDAWVNRGTPVGSAKTVSAKGITEGGGDNPIIGFSILQADNLGEVLAMVESSPHIKDGGTMVVAEMKSMGDC